MFGNYKYNPKNPDALLESDLDNFVFCLLSDVLEDSSNLDLKNETKINYALMTDVNLDGKKFLLSFQLNKLDPRNADFLKKFDDTGKYADVVFEVALMTPLDTKILNTEDYYSGVEFKRIFETLILAITDNHNADLNTPVAPNYKVTLDNNKVLSNNLELNKADNNAQYFISQINGNSGNYLTGLTNILFSIVKE
jgi:hypothetical protein